MELGALQEHADTGIRRFESELGAGENEDLVFLYLNRINEDIGNLSSAVMKSAASSHQSFADALYSITMLAKKMGVDLQDAMSEKLQRLAAQEEASF